MKQFLLCLLATSLFLLNHVNGQRLHKQDSLLTIYVNNLAKHSNMPCDAIKKIEQDSARKIIIKEFGVVNRSSAKDMNGNKAYPMDSAKLSFVFKERITKDLLKKRNCK